MPEGNEEKVFAPKSEETMREEVIAEFDFDEETDSERITKLVGQRLEHQKELSTAIEQKVRQRSKAETLEQKLKDSGIDPETGERRRSPESSDLSAREISSLRKEIEELKMSLVGDFPDEVKREIEQLSKLNGISYKEASDSDYIRFRTEQINAKKRAELGSLDGGNGSAFSGSRLENVSPEQFRQLNEEEWEKKKQLIKQGKS